MGGHLDLLARGDLRQLGWLKRRGPAAGRGRAESDVAGGGGAGVLHDQGQGGVLTRFGFAGETAIGRGQGDGR